MWVTLASYHQANSKFVLCHWLQFVWLMFCQQVVNVFKHQRDVESTVTPCPRMSWNEAMSFSWFVTILTTWKRQKRHLPLPEGCRANRTPVFGPSEGKRNMEQAGVCGGWAELDVLRGSVFSFYTSSRADWGEGPRPPSSLCCVYLSCLMCSAQKFNIALSKNVLFRFCSMPHERAVHVPVSVCLK